MHFYFSDGISVNVTTAPTLISGADSAAFPAVEYLIMQKDEQTSVFEIRYEYHVAPFKDAMLIDDILIIGHEVHCYVFNIRLNYNLLTLEVYGYFGHLYFNNNYFYVTDAEGIYCINLMGQIIWQNKDLGIDGVLIIGFNDECIHGNAQFDPPDGWRSFTLECNTGRLTN